MTAAEQARCLLLMVGELHKQGYERLRVAPRFADSPGGPVWQCRVVPDFFTHQEHGAVETDCPSELTYFYSTRGARNVEKLWPELTNMHPDLAAGAWVLSHKQLCAAGHGSDPEYVSWYAEMLGQTEPGGVIYAGSRDLRGGEGTSPPGVLSVFNRERPDLPRYVCAPPRAMIHSSDLSPIVPLVLQISTWRGKAGDVPLLSFWTNVLQVFEASPDSAREYLTTAVKSNSAALNTLLSDEVLAVGAGPYLTAPSKHSDGESETVSWLRKVLCVVSLTEGFEDSRDTMIFLANLWRKAEDCGLDPTPHFQHYADISSDRSDHTFCGSAQLMMHMVLDPGLRDSLRV
jgi:hypothetical protein